MSSGGEKEQLSDHALSNIDYWDAFHKAAAAAGAPLRKIDRPLKDTNYWIPFGPKGNAYLSAWRSQAKKATIGVFLGLYNSPAPFVWQRLDADRDSYTAAFGESLDWQQNRDGKLFKAVARLPVTSPSDRSDWPRQHAWLIDRLKRLESIFGEPVQQALADYAAESGSSNVS